MTRNLYRLYLYAVLIVLLIFAAIATGVLLNTLLTFTSLRGSFASVPSQASVVQSAVFAVVSWIVVGLLGGLHYWLIRRDLRHDSVAGGSAMRSFFLNIPEAISVVLGVPLMGFFVIGSFVQSSSSSVVGFAAFAIPAFGLALLLELERRRTRTQVTKGAALVFQRLHLYGVQLVLLFFFVQAWFIYFRPLVDELLFGSRGEAASCQGFGTGGYCPTFNLFGVVAALLWFAAFWTGYGLIVRKDHARLPHLIVQGASFAYGVGFVLSGLYYGLEFAISPLFKLSVGLGDVLGLGPRYDFVTPLTVGLLIAAVYHLWLQVVAKQGLMDRVVLSLMQVAIVGVLSAALFWWGIGNLIDNAIQTLSPIPSAPDAQTWVSAIAFVLAGLGYIPVGFYLYRRNRIAPTTVAGPRRGFVLALLGGGILASAIGGATALYAWITSVSGFPIAEWQQVAHTGVSAFVVGLILVGLYLRTAIREHLVSGLIKRSPTSPLSPAPTPSKVTTQPATIEGVLDELLAGKITRDEAVAQIRSLVVSPVGTGS